MHGQKGSILILTVFVCAALLIMAACLMDLNSTDVRIAANQRDGLQAYYLAAAGMELALGLLAEKDPFYCGSGEIPFAGGTIELKLSARDLANGSRQVQITSTGKLGVISEQIVADFQSFPADSGCTDGAGLGWYDRDSGVITPGDHGAEGAVSLGRPALSSLTLGSGDGGGAVFSAGEIVFRSNLALESDLKIMADSAAFQKNICLYPQEGSLYFLNPSGDPLRVYLRGELSAPGSPPLEPGVYLFPHGLLITKDSSLSELRRYRVFPAVPGTMILSKGITG